MSFLHQNSETSEEIGADISIYLGSSVLYWHVVKQFVNQNGFKI